MTGAPSDHFNGKTFFNPGGASPAASSTSSGGS